MSNQDPTSDATYDDDEDQADKAGKRPRLVLCDDHTLIRQSLAQTLVEAVGDVVGQAGDGREALLLIERLQPDVVLLDIGMPPPDGLQVAAEVRRRWPDVKVVLVTMFDDDAILRRATEVGVDGYLTKTASIAEFVTAIDSVLSGGSWISPAVATKLMRLTSGNRPDDLTDRERDVLEELAAGERISAIAGRLFVSEKTIKNHLTSIYAKLGAETAAQAVAVAYRSGMVSATRATPSRD